MAKVYLLYHVSHALREGPARDQHLDDFGTPLCDEQAGDDVKLLGAYSSDERAKARISAARLLPGFRDEPDCFQISAYVVDRDEWPSGFVID